jgi:hypothetical protein
MVGRAANKNWPIYVPLNNFYCIFFTAFGISEEHLRLPVSQEIRRQVNMREMRRQA